MLVKMKTNYGGPRGNCDAGKTIDLPEAEAKGIIAGGFGDPARPGDRKSVKASEARE